MTDEIPAPNSPRETTLTYVPCGPSGGERVRFVPYDGDPIEANYLRITETRNAEGWRETGSQPVESVRVEANE